MGEGYSDICAREACASSDRVWFHPWGGGYSFIWPIWGCAAEQEIVFYLSVLNRVYNFI